MHKKVYKTKRWQQTRQAVFDRDKLICYFCHKLVTSRPTVHHLEELDEENWWDENIAYKMDNLVTCHHECHNEHHQRFGFNVKKTIVNDDLSIDYDRRKC